MSIIYNCNITVCFPTLQLWKKILIVFKPSTDEHAVLTSFLCQVILFACAYVFLDKELCLIRTCFEKVNLLMGYISNKETCQG